MRIGVLGCTRVQDVTDVPDSAVSWVGRVVFETLELRALLGPPHEYQTVATLHIQ
jgi:hypothetical protein